MNDAQRLIDALGMTRHPEGGWFLETYRAGLKIPAHGGERAVATAIHYLLERGDFSALHRLRSDELWFFHQGAPLQLTILHPDGRLEQPLLGADLTRHERAFAAVPAGAWFGAEVTGGGAWSLVSCAVAPGFDYADFELAPRADLLARFPQHRATIEWLTREGP